MDDAAEEDKTHNELSGSAANVVQARDISGGVHFHSGSVPLPVPRQLPPDVMYFTNREKYMAQLHAWLDAPYQHIAPPEVIAGIGGVGKTSLAAHWAHQVRDRFPDGDLYVDLRGYHVERSISAEEALDQLLHALEVPTGRIPVGLDGKSALYRSILYDRRMLIILDNAATVEQIRPLLPGSPTCRVLVTSRSRLEGLTTREGAHRMPLDVLPPERAIDLLRQIAGEDRVQDDPAAAAELARYCGYLPLALRIAAERLVTSPYFSIADIVAQLADARERLNELGTDDEFTTVRSVFSWSYRALPPDLARMFRLLGLPAGPDISVGAAAALADVTDRQARQQLDKLVGAHLLQEIGPQRYRFHDLLRVYSSECAEADESETDRQDAVRRMLTWYLHAVDVASHAIAPHIFRIPFHLPGPVGRTPEFSDRLAALRWCDAEKPNLMSTPGQAADIGEHVLAWQLPVVFLEFLLVRRPFLEWIATHQIGLESARLSGDLPAQAWLQTSVSIAHRELMQYELALENLQRALVDWRTIGIRWAEAWALRDTGSIYRLLNRPDEAISVLLEALAIHTAEGDSWGQAV